MRRRAATALVVAAVLAVAVAAVVDAVRPGAPSSLDPSAAAQLRRLGATGTLIYTDASCKLHVLSLPGLKPAQKPEGRYEGCEISVSPDGRRVGGANVRWSADSAHAASCRGACAWRGHELTFFRAGAIRTATAVLVPRAQLLRAALSHPNVVARTRVEDLGVRDIAWTSPHEVVALIEARYASGPGEGTTVVAGFRDGRLARQRPYFGGYQRLVVSHAGDVLLEPAVQTQLRMLSRSFHPSGPIDWAPDGRRLAVSTRASVYVVDTHAEQHVRIPLTVRDLAWR